MKLTVFVEDGFELDIRPARADRAWMAAFNDGFAYGCLPMMIANQHGWEICSPVSFTVIWNGGKSKDCLAVLPDEPGNHRILSHFGFGIVTFSFPAVFRTEPGYDLVIGGPPNFPVDGATPLTGTAETDWLLSSIAMHWQLTRPNHAVRFRKGDPLVQIFPVRRGELESVSPELKNVSDEPEVEAYMRDWQLRRRAFQAALQIPDSKEKEQRWPGHYRRGHDVTGAEIAPDNHRTRQRLHAFADKRGQSAIDANGQAGPASGADSGAIDVS
jgi:hypothetical protein